MIWTSNFARCARAQGAISIARWQPRWKRVERRYEEFWPDAPALKAYLEKQMTWDEYEARYNARLALLDPELVARHLLMLVHPYDPILLCHCGVAKVNCHRHLVAAWFRASGIEAAER